MDRKDRKNFYDDPLSNAFYLAALLCLEEETKANLYANAYAFTFMLLEKGDSDRVGVFFSGIVDAQKKYEEQKGEQNEQGRDN